MQQTHAAALHLADGSQEVSDVADRIRHEFLTRIDLADLLTVTPK